VLTALWERDIPFTYRHLEDPGAGEELGKLWPVGKFPVLVDDGRTVAETSIIIEYLDLHHGSAPKLIPADPEAALEVRMMDRFFDLHVMNAMQGAVNEAIRGMRGQQSDRQEEASAAARAALDTAYGWLETRLAGRTWAAGEAFSMADCAAGPSLFYADWVHPIGEQFPTVRAYRARLLAHPSFARAVEEGRKYRHYFPLGAPDRD
jgi:glutathione S-transferase